MGALKLIDEINAAQAEDNGFTLETGIAIPEGRTERVAKYPFREMEVGHSFFVKDAKVSTFQTLCHSWGKKLGHKFVCREWSTGAAKGVRVWRKA